MSQVAPVDGFFPNSKFVCGIQIQILFELRVGLLQNEFVLTLYAYSILYNMAFM